MKKAGIALGIWIAVFLAVNAWWNAYSAPTAIAERITELDLPPTAKIVSFLDTFLDTYSMLFSSGITCGQLSVGEEHMDNFMKQLRDKQYLPNLNAGQTNFYNVFRQRGCCQDLSINLRNVPGRYKILCADRFQTNYVFVDSLHRNIYFFRSIHDLTHQSRISQPIRIF